VKPNIVEVFIDVKLSIAGSEVSKLCDNEVDTTLDIFTKDKWKIRDDIID